MSDIFTEIGQVVLTSLLSLAAMFIFTRAGGKRQIAQMSPFDYLNAVTVGSIGAELATNLEQWLRPFSALIVYGVVTWFVHYSACKSNRMRSFWSGRSLILMAEDVDEFCLQILRTYPRKDAEGKDGTVEFKNVNSGDLGLESEEEKKAAEDATAENKALFDAMKDALNGKVKEVKVSTRLKDHPVCLSADGPLSIEMEKVLSKQPGSEGVKSDKVLELNVNHPVFAALKAAQEAGDTEKLNKYSALLYAQAQLIEGLPVDDPAAYAEAVCSLMK